MDKNLFPYNLAVVAIFKDEAPYLREWLDYHLLAGVEHFYLYNNESSDGYAEILKPYVEANLVTLTDWPGKIMQLPAYNAALNRYRFLCRYMAFIDLDEFIFPKTNQSVVEIVDEILSRDEMAAALGINWQYFGSNDHETADLSRGVLERFTRRAPSDWVIWLKDENKLPQGNIYIKSIVNPRRTERFINPHFATYFGEFIPLNDKGEEINQAGNFPVAVDRIVVNHYYTKSREEFFGKKMMRGWACGDVTPYDSQKFSKYDRNEAFDDGILKYRAARAENFSLKSDADKIRRVEKVLVDILTQCSPFDAPAEFFTGKLETFLTCRKLAEILGTRIGNKSAEEYALVWIYQTLTHSAVNDSERQLLLAELPALTSRPFPLCQKILNCLR